MSDSAQGYQLNGLPFLPSLPVIHILLRIVVGDPYHLLLYLESGGLRMAAEPSKSYPYNLYVACIWVAIFPLRLHRGAQGLKAR